MINIFMRILLVFVWIFLFGLAILVIIFVYRLVATDADDFAIAKPDLIIFLDVEPEIARTRKTSELKKKNWMEKDFELTQKTYKQYKSLIKSQTWARWVSVDGSGEIDPIADTIFDIIQKELDKK